ncbi:MAG TPA: hypothetical protein VN643_12035 [Pyrinomonadaceae bacterium]|nr:hypothetical protein [Pyrinomonadaceae bacterium]
MTSKMKRPPTVWLTQILLFVFAFLFMTVLLRDIFGRPRVGGEIDVSGLTALVVVFLGIVGVLLLAFWGLVRRRNYGRKLSVFCLFGLWTMVNLAQLFRCDGPVQCYEYSNTGQLVGAGIAIASYNALFLFLMFRLSLGKKVRNFFSSQPSQPEVS